MNARFAALALALVAGHSATAQQLNEVYASHTGTDDMEFIELKGAPNTKLDNFMVLVVEGEGANAGTLDRAWDLAGQTIPNDGYFVLGDDAVPNVDFKLGASNTIENGTETIYLVKTTMQAAIKLLVGTNVDPDGDKKTTIPTLATIVDIIAMVDSGISSGDKTYDGATEIGPDGNFFPAGIYRAADANWCTTGFLDFDDVANTNAPSTAGAFNTILCIPATIEVKGMSCLTGAGTAGGPDLAATKPAIGKSFDSTVSNVGASPVGFLYGGVEAAPSPFLQCSIYLNTSALVNLGALTFSGTTGTLNIALPYSTGLLGTKFAVQAAVSSGSSLHLTNALLGQIGY